MSKLNKCKGLNNKKTPKLFKALCDPNRLSILSWLASKAQSCSVKEVSNCCSVDLSVVSRHLKIMKEAEILESSKQGKEVHYSVNCASLAKTLRQIADELESCCPPKQKRKLD